MKYKIHLNKYRMECIFLFRVENGWKNTVKFTTITWPTAM
jgi:hypothetical protein